MTINFSFDLTSETLAKLPWLTGFLERKRRSGRLSLDRLSNRFALKKTRLFRQRPNLVGFRSPAALTLTGQHLCRLPTLTQPKFPLSHAPSMCSLSSFGMRADKVWAPKAVRSYTTGSVSLGLLLIEYQYKLSILGMGQSHSVWRPCPFLFVHWYP